MPNSCFISGCKSGYRSTKEKRHLFKVGNNLQEWSKCIPSRRDRELCSKDSLCELHFESRFIIKQFTHIINGETVIIPRVKWDLTSDAVPTKFSGKPTHVTAKTKPQTSKQVASPKANSLSNKSKPDLIAYVSGSDFHISEIVSESAASESYQLNSTSADDSCSDFSHTDYSGNTCDSPISKLKRKPLPSPSISKSRQKTVPILTKERDTARRTQRRQKAVIKKLKDQISYLKREVEGLKMNLDENEVIVSMLPERQREIVSHMMKAAKCDPKGMRYSEKWILDCISLRAKSSDAYEFMRISNYLPLPDRATLHRYVPSGMDVNSVFGLTDIELDNQSVSVQP